MKLTFILVVFSCFFLIHCSNQSLQKTEITGIDFRVLFNNSEIIDSLTSFRAIDVFDQSIVVGGNPNLVAQIQYSEEDGFQDGKIIKLQDTLSYDFRSVAITDDQVYALSAGSPAKLYKGNSIDELKLVYTETGKEVFYDSMKFWNDKEGIAFGDEINGCMSVLISRDGGESWKKLSCDNFLPANEGDGAFAASNTNIDIVNKHAWLAAGTSIYRSENKGKDWEKIKVPIVQNKDTEGIYSIDFHCEKLGIAIGGDYTSPENNTNNLLLTKDGGKNWEVISDADSPGYRSCIQFIPNTNGHGIMAVGFKGIDVSQDRGQTWKHISNEAYYSFRFVNSTTGIIIGKGKIHQFTLTK